MGLRFRKSIKLFSGVRLNLGKSGFSTSIGTKGATVNLKPGRNPKISVGIPGTGISYSSQLGDAPPVSTTTASTPVPRRYSTGMTISAILFVIGLIAVYADPSNPLGWFPLLGGGIATYQLRP